MLTLVKKKMLLAHVCGYVEGNHRLMYGLMTIDFAMKKGGFN